MVIVFVASLHTDGTDLECCGGQLLRVRLHRGVDAHCHEGAANHAARKV